MPRGDVDQLSLLRVPPPPPRRLPRRVRPMQAGEGVAPFDDPAYLFEPWWPGARALIFLEAGQLRMQAAQLADPLVAFPQLRGIGDQIRDDGVVIDGVVLVLDRTGRPDPALLRARLDGLDGAGGRPAYLATDLLYRRGHTIRGQPFAERRRLLQETLRPVEWCSVSRGYPGEGTTVAEALAALGLAAMSARRLERRYRAGPADDAWLRIPLVPQEPRSRRPTLTLIRGFGL